MSSNINTNNTNNLFSSIRSNGISLNLIITSISYYTRTTLKIFILLFITIYFIYVNILFSNTDNYYNTRQVCLSESNICNSPMNSYHSVVLNDDDNYLQYSFPICYYQNTACVNDITLNYCKKVLSADSITYTTESLNSEIKNEYINYIPYSIWVIIFSSTSLILTFLFDNIHINRVRQGEFNSTNDRINMKRLNNTIIICSIGFLIATLYSYSLMNPISCVNEFKGDNNLCISLAQCGALLSIIINPDSLLLSHFVNIVIASIILVVISLIIHKSESFSDIYTINNDDATPRPNRTIVMTRNNGEYQMIPIDINNLSVDEAERLFLQRVVYNDSPASISSTTPIGSLAHNVMSKWKFYQSVNDLKQNDCMECSICLCELFPKKQINSDKLNTTAIRPRSIRCVRPAAVDDNQNQSSVFDNSNDRFSNIYRNNNDVISYEINTSPNTNTNSASAVGSAKSEVDGNNIVVEVPCGHCFHKLCILQWCLQQRDSIPCPICRQSL